MRKYVFVFSQVHVDFRRAELESICALRCNIPCDQNIALLTDQQHVYLFEFPSVNCVTAILLRSVLVKYALEWITSSNDYDKLCADIIARRDETNKYDSTDQSFAIYIRTIGRKSSRSPRSIILDIGKALDFKESPVDLDTPCNSFYVIEEYHSNSLKNLHFGKLIGCGQGHLKNHYALTERCYIGNTTMDPELSFLQANIAKVDTGSLVLDPFCGTGGLLIAAAHFGAAVMGSEINYRIARAVGRSSRAGVKYIAADESVAENFRQYGTDNRFMGLVIADASQHNLWHPGTHSGTVPVFDAVITDPPYGVREKGQKVGVKEKESWIVKDTPYTNHYPEKLKYSISSTFLDLVDLASKLLIVGGRLIFWFPVFEEEYSEAVLPKHDAMKLIYNCEQVLSRRYSRRLLAYEKLRMVKDGEKAYIEKDCYENITFRQRVFMKR